MLYASIHQQFIRYLNLEEFGFKCTIIDNDPIIATINFERDNEKNKSKENFYYEVTEGKRVNIQSINSRVGFNEVNKIYYPTWYKYNSDIYGDHFHDEPTVYQYPNHDKNTDLILTELDKINLIKANKWQLNDIIQSAKILRSYFIKTVLPFYEIVGTLENVHEEIIKKIPQMKIANYIEGDIVTKKLIIMKLCNNPDYDEYVTWADGAYAKGMSINPDRYFKDYNVYKEVRDKLSTTNV